MKSIHQVALHDQMVAALAQRTRYPAAPLALAGRRLLQERLRAGLPLLPGPQGIEPWARSLWQKGRDSYTPLPPVWLPTAEKLWVEFYQSLPCVTCIYFHGQGGLHCVPQPLGRPEGRCEDWSD